ncbi:MAG: ABC transporter permease [Chloroflexi bacterium]|nr:ABC transporter permease [Chloroflexota bacterium]
MNRRETSSSAGYASEAYVRRRPHVLLEIASTIIRHKPLGLIGASIILFFGSVAILAPLLAPHSYDLRVGRPFLGPGQEGFLLGTDYVGRDVLTRLMYGARSSLLVGLVTTLLGTGGAAFIGIVSGYAGRGLDLLVQRLVDAVQAFPGLVLILAIISVFGTGLLDLVVTLASLIAAGQSRIVRSATMAVKEEVYIEAARSIGAGPGRIIFRHILPNVFAPIIIIATTTLGGVILIEAALSFLGLGVPPPMPTWGGMLSGRALTAFNQSPWLAVFPGLALTLTVFGFNMLGDALRDVLDPKLRGR